MALDVMVSENVLIVFDMFESRFDVIVEISLTKEQFSELFKIYGHLLTGKLKPTFFFWEEATLD